MTRHLLPLVVLAAACRPELEIALIPEPEDDFQAVFVLDSETTEAGEAVAYTLEVTNRGEPVDATWVVSSDLEDALQFSLEDVSPIVAGTHELTVDVQTEGWETTLEASLVVDAGRIYDLDLVLADAAALAGDAVGYEVFASDAYGNVLSVESAVVATDSPDLVLDGATVTSTVPGSYLVTAEMGGLEDVEPVWFDAGVPASVDLTLSSMTLRRGGTANATVDVFDQFGNPTWAEWTLTTDRPLATSISGRNITFNEDGWHTVTVTLDVSGLSDSEGPLLIDDTGPELDPTWPPRAEWTTAITETVRGAVEDAWSDVTLTINGDSVEVTQDGTYAMGVSLPWGVSTWDVTAQDGAGNQTTRVSAVLSGEYLPYGAMAPDSVTARLAEGPGGTETLEVLGRGLIDSQDLTSLIPNPVYTNRSRSCIDPCGGWFGGCEFCFTWYSVTLRVQNPSLGPSDLYINPRADGRIGLRLSIEDPYLGWNASGVVAEIGYSGSGAIVADRFNVDLVVRPRVQSGRLVLDLESVNTTAVGFDFQFADWLQDALGFFGFDADDYLAGLMEDAIDDAVRDALPPVLEDTLNSFDLAFSVDVGDDTMDVAAQFTSVTVNETGLGFGLGTQVTTSNWVRADQGLGSLAGQFARPAPTSSPGTQLGLSVDLINQIAYAAWGSGLLDIDQSLTELGLPEDELQLFLPGVTSITAVVDPLLPPVVVPGTAGDDLDLQLGDMQLTLYNGDPAANNVIIRVYITAVAGMNVTAVGDDRLAFDVGNADLWYDVTVPESNTQAAADTEALIGAIVPLLLPRITDVFSEIEVPSFAGFRIDNVQVGMGGEANAVFVIGGNLSPE